MCATSTPLAGQIAAPISHDLTGIDFTTEGRFTSDALLLELASPRGFTGLVVVDREGTPLWAFQTEGDPRGTLVRADGTVVVLDASFGLVWLTIAGDTLATLPSSEEMRIHHDVVEAPGGRLLFLARDQADLSGEVVVGEAIWSWDPTSGATRRLWSAFDHLSWRTDRSPRSRPNNWLHANSLSVNHEGDWIVSLSFLDQVIALSDQGRTIAWRLGGPRATHVPDSPFSGAHTATEVAPGRVLLFDNGFSARSSERPSRAVEYSLADGEARVVWSFQSPTGTTARVVSSARRLADGNTLVTFGAQAGLRGSSGPIEVYEVSPTGEVIARMLVEGPVRTLYRATPAELPIG